MGALNGIVMAGEKAAAGDIGGKASALAALGENFPIPQWFAVTKDAFLASLDEQQKQALSRNEPLGAVHLSPQLKSAVQQSVEKLSAFGHSFAVRSSAIGEDGVDASYAGQLKSFLNIPASDVAEHIEKVWMSAFVETVRDYRKSLKQQDQALLPAVLVQVMVAAETAGVAFSRDPVSGNPDICVINATQGLADKLVSGEVNGDLYYTDRAASLIRQKTVSAPLLKAEQINKIIQLLRKVEDHFQRPQDIEWAIKDNIVYLLQARPITTLRTGTENDETVIWDNSNIVESYSGVTSPLTFSFARYVYAHVYIEFCRLMKVSEQKIQQEVNTFENMLGSINGHVYYNLLNWYRMLALFPGFKMNRAFMEQMMGVKEPLPEAIVKKIVPQNASLAERVLDGLNLGRTCFGLLLNHLLLPRKIRKFYLRLESALSCSVDEIQSMSLDQLAKEYRKLESRLLRAWDAPLINDFLCMIAFGISRKMMQQYAGEAGLAYHNDWMIGQGDIISAEPAKRMQAMAEILCQYPEHIEALTSGDKTRAYAAIAAIPQLQQLYQEYLAKFSDRCLQELKLESPTLEDDPVTLLTAVGYMARQLHQGRIHTSTYKALPELSALVGQKPVRLWLIKHLLQSAKMRVRDRENLRFERTRVFGRVRRIFLEMGRRLQRQGLLASERDIFSLEVHEILGFVEGTLTISSLKELAALRAKELENFRLMPAPPNRFETRGAVGESLKRQISQSLQQVLDAHSVQGIGCCQGIVKAQVRVINDPRGAELKPGEIMVAQFTDPGWITLFANAAGILVERGSLLSHSAIVSREMNIPAIVAIDGLMSWLQTGDWVEMDGSTGIAKKVEAP